MKIRIVKQPTGTVEGWSLDRYHPGDVYEVAPTLANYLVAEGFATFEMRDAEHPTPPPAKDRRRKR